MSTRTDALWKKLMEGELPVDESVAITSSDVNRQTAANMSAVSGGSPIEGMRALVLEQIEGAQQDGMKLGIKFGAKTLRGIADELSKEPHNADYLRGLRDAAVFIERFAQDVTLAGDAK